MIFAQQDPIVFDGQLGEDEWNRAQRLSIDYEIQPGNNSPAPHKTDVFVLYSATHLYVGFDAKANMASLRSAIRNRDEAFQDDIVMFGVDTFDNDYLIQPLLQWNPTPFTIFYIGGNNNYQFNDRFDAYRLDDAQLYLKFQYQIGN